MATYLLVHGAFHGAWAWERVTPLLEEAGHSVIAPDLPGSGADQTPVSEITLQAYVDRVTAEIDAAPEPVILVGHSMGGLVITQTAEFRPRRIAKLVYLCANLLSDGERLLDTFQREENNGSLALENFVVIDDGLAATTTPEGWQPAYFNDCSDEDMAWLLPQLRPQALPPLSEPVSTSDEGWGSVPRIYIECTKDQTLLLAVQRQMVSQSPCERVITLQTSHSPFVSAPAELAAALLSVAD